MKTAKIVLLTILCGLIAFLCTLLVWGARSEGDAHAKFGQSYELAGEWEMPAAEISGLYIDYSINSNDVYLYEGTGDNIIIREYVNFKQKEEWFSTVTQEGSSLIIKGKRRRSGFFWQGGFNSDAYIEIYLPSGLLTEIDIAVTSGEIRAEQDFKGCESFKVESSSGDIQVQRVTAEKIVAGTSSGYITFDYAQGEVTATASSGDIIFYQILGDAVISTSSGDITVKQIEGNAAVSASSGDVVLCQAQGDVTVSTSSGDIQVLGGSGLRNLSASSGSIKLADMEGRFNLHTTSGEIYVENGSGYGEAKASSGDVSIRLMQLNGSLDINTTSGEVAVYIPSEVSFSFVFDSNSGECVTFFDDCLSFNRRGTSAKGDYGSSPDKTIGISTSSGDVYIGEQ
ncbi:MAG: DUF4097 domain-containing protein [Lachnospiraceae bacterium]|nr:DUF4097 domain-containing protein [Lachnospiraceae bacterium]